MGGVINRHEAFIGQFEIRIKIVVGTFEGKRAHGRPSH
jgi:hypothetical protein